MSRLARPCPDRRVACCRMADDSSEPKQSMAVFCITASATGQRNTVAPPSRTAARAIMIYPVALSRQKRRMGSHLVASPPRQLARQLLSHSVCHRPLLSLFNLLLTTRLFTLHSTLFPRPSSHISPPHPSTRLKPPWVRTLPHTPRGPSPTHQQYDPSRRLPTPQLTPARTERHDSEPKRMSEDNVSNWSFSEDDGGWCCFGVSGESRSVLVMCVVSAGRVLASWLCCVFCVCCVCWLRSGCWWSLWGPWSLVATSVLFALGGALGALAAVARFL